eukprot:878239-Pyramimonas_sp.AAC.1
MATSVFHSGEIRGQGSVAVAARGMADACNQLVSAAGLFTTAVGAGSWTSTTCEFGESRQRPS